MAFKRDRPGNPAVRKGKEVGPDYSERLYRNPFDAGVDHESGSEAHKTISSPANTITGVDIPLHHGYDELWKGK